MHHDAPVTSHHGRSWVDGLLVIAIGGLALQLGALSIARYLGYNAGMLDLGNMAQAIASVRRGHPLISTFPDGPISRLALHVELFYFLFVPLYAVWPDPRLLLGIQALLFALGALPVFAMTLRTTGSRLVAGSLALIYLLYPTAQTSVLFDVHGDTLAMPLLLFALNALDRRRWRAYWLWIVLALSCKFYVALPVALLGLLLLQRGERRIGTATAALGMGYGAIAFFVIRPLFTTAQTPVAHTGMNYLSFYFGRISELVDTIPDRLVSAIVVFGPAILLIWIGWRWLLPALPIAAAALLSTGPGGAFDYRYHHYAIVVPFIIRAAIEGVRIKQAAANGGQLKSNWRSTTFLTLMITLVFAVPLVDTPLNPLFWLGQPGYGRDTSVYGRTSRDGVTDRFLAERVPAAVPLAASAFLAPHLADRDTLYLVRYPDDPGAQRLPAILPKVDYVVSDSLFDWRMPLDEGYSGGVAYERDALTLLLHDPAFVLTDERDGLLLFQRSALPNQALTQAITSRPADPSMPALHTFGDAIDLIDHHVEQLPSAQGERRLRAHFTWRVAHSLRGPHLIAVSRLEGVPNARFVHLPSAFIVPVESWQPGQFQDETFDIALPADLPPGNYTWRVGWYDPSNLAAADTDDRSRIGDEVALQLVEVR